MSYVSEYFSPYATEYYGTGDGGEVIVVLPIIVGGKFTVPLFLGDDYLTVNGRDIRLEFTPPTGLVLGSTTAILGFSDGKHSYKINGTVALSGTKWVAIFQTDYFGDDEICAGLYDWTITLVSGDVRISILTNMADNYRAKIIKKRT